MESNTLAPLRVLQILQKYSDKNHKLKHQEIINILDREYGISSERKKITRILTNLETAGYIIERTKNGCYLECDDFDDSELRLLIDSVLFSKHIPSRFADDLINKLKNLGSISFREKAKYIYHANSFMRTAYKDIFYNIDIISQAITEKKAVSFFYNMYDLDATLHHVVDEKYMIYPYILMATNNNYYLVGEELKSKKVLSLRVEKITDIEIVTTREKCVVFDPAKYLLEHPYMQYGHIVYAVIKIDFPLIDEFIDKFGKNFSIIDQDEITKTICLTVNDSDLVSWAKENGDLVEVISPQSIRDQLREFSTGITKKYHQSETDRYNSSIKAAMQLKGTHNSHLILTNIDLSKKTEHEKLSFLTHIQFINNNLDDFSFLERFNDLESLIIEDNPVADLSYLINCYKIKNLKLKNTKISDIGFIGEFEDIEDLCLVDNPITDFSPIYNLFNLRRLTVQTKDALFFDISKLKKCCPHLVISIIAFNNDDAKNCDYTNLSFAEHKILATLSNTFCKKEFSAYFSKEEANTALEYINNNTEFSFADFHDGINKIYSLKASCNKNIGYQLISFIKAKSLLNWCIETHDVSYNEQDNMYYRTMLDSQKTSKL